MKRRRYRPNFVKRAYRRNPIGTALVLLGLLGAGAYVYTRKKGAAAPGPGPQPGPTPTPQPPGPGGGYQPPAASATQPAPTGPEPGAWLGAEATVPDMSQQLIDCLNRGGLWAGTYCMEGAADPRLVASSTVPGSTPSGFVPTFIGYGRSF